MDENIFNGLMDDIIKRYNSLSMEEKIKLFEKSGIKVSEEDIRKYKPNMQYNYKMLKKRVIDCLNDTDLDVINRKLGKINNSTITSGVGGSSVVSLFASKVLEKKNNIICKNTTLRDLNYINMDNYTNLLICSYGGTNYGVKNALESDLNKYLLSKNKIDGINNITYNVNEDEISFISLAATLIPMSILLEYYLDKDTSLIKEILSDDQTPDVKSASTFEVLSGIETSTAHTFLESTFIESGIANIIIHDKYDYCHGRSNLNYFNKNNSIILFNNNTELDKLFLEELQNYYENIYVFDKKYEDDLVNDYYLTYKSMLFAKKLAEKKNMELSNIKYCPFVKKLYKYNGGM